jgi:hypothetical protein
VQRTGESPISLKDTIAPGVFTPERSLTTALAVIECLDLLGCPKMADVLRFERRNRTVREGNRASNAQTWMSVGHLRSESYVEVINNADVYLR